MDIAIYYLKNLTHNYGGACSLMAACISGVVVFLVANLYTKEMKSADSTLEFSKRYNDLMADSYPSAFEGETETSILLGARPKHWWIRFFDLMFFQYQFYLRGLVFEERFISWMERRQIDYAKSEGGSGSLVGYAKGWELWTKNISGSKTGFKEFMDLVHNPQLDVEYVVSTQKGLFCKLRLYYLRSSPKVRHHNDNGQARIALPSHRHSPA